MQGSFLKFLVSPAKEFKNGLTWKPEDKFVSVLERQQHIGKLGVLADTRRGKSSKLEVKEAGRLGHRRLQAAAPEIFREREREKVKIPGMEGCLS